MWIVQLALRRPYTFIVAALLVMLIGTLSVLRMPKDIFPEINIPIINVIWTYTGLSAQEMDRQLTTFSEFAISNNVGDVKRIESQSVSGIALVRIYFQPNVNIASAMGQVTAACQTILRRLPTGTTPPLIIQYNAAAVPIMQMSIASDTKPEAALEDYGRIGLRQRLSAIQGMTLPLPLGGKPRQIMVDLDLKAIRSLGISPEDVATAVTAGSFTLPSGTMKVGDSELAVTLNSMPDTVAQLADIPIKTIGTTTVFLRDVANIRDGFAPQNNIVRQDGKRGVTVPILKRGGASTLDITDQIRALLPTMQATAPEGITLKPVADQSVLVRNSIKSVLLEGTIAAGLTATMILIFLGSWRSTLIVSASIPLAIMISIIGLDALGYSLNIMTLGGLALAVGILVDDATVEIENIHRNMAMGKSIRRSILDGAQQIALPAFVGTTAICIVFVSVVFLEDVARYLFVPFALAVVFSVGSSYLLSRTIIPTLAMYLLPGEAHMHTAEAHMHTAEAHGDAGQASGQLTGATAAKQAPSRNPITLVHNTFNLLFDAFRNVYTAALSFTVRHRSLALAGYLLVVASAVLLLPMVGRNFFPGVDGGQIRLYARFPASSRLEQTERRFAQMQQIAREVIPDSEVEQVIDNIGQPQGLNFGFLDVVNVGSFEGEMTVILTEHRSRPTAEYARALRERLVAELPDGTFAFRPADMVNQVLNAGVPAPINIQVTGNDRAAAAAATRTIRDKLAAVPGVVDARVGQVTGLPNILVDVDRAKASQLGLSQRQVASSMLVSLSSSSQVSPNFWVDPRNGIGYALAVQTPDRNIDSIEELENSPFRSPRAGEPAVPLSNLASIRRTSNVASTNKVNIQPTFDVLADVEQTDLGSVSAPIEKIIAEVQSTLPPGVKVSLRGQMQSMNDAYRRLGFGIGFAALLVYLLMVVNFQSWSTPLAVVLGLPGALSGIVWMLFVTHTTFSVPSLMGTIMCIGVSTLNSILLVTFINDMRQHGLKLQTALVMAGRLRLRPICMTALAMIVGMLPMALGLGEGGEQNAPLGRAVIGGLLLSTLTTLLIVPVLYSIVSARAPRPTHHDDEDDAHHAGEAARGVAATALPVSTGSGREQLVPAG